MSVTKICKYCGKEYEYCHSLRPDNIFRWETVACCPEHAELVAKMSRGEKVPEFKEEPVTIVEEVKPVEVKLEPTDVIEEPKVEEVKEPVKRTKKTRKKVEVEAE